MSELHPIQSNIQLYSHKNHKSEQQTKKVLSLQDELLKVRKEISNKQIQWEKERSHLLSKQQISNLQILQLKQRINNLSQLNKTLTDALSNDEKPTQKPQRKNQYQAYEKKLKSYEQKLYQQQTKISELTQQLYEQEQQMMELKDTIHHKQQQIDQFTKQIAKLSKQPSKKNKNIKELTIDDLSQFDTFPQHYQRNSSYLKPTSDHNFDESYIPSEISDYPEANFQTQKESMEDRLLCEVCSGIFSFQEFQHHMKRCGHRKQSKDLRYLLQKRKAIEDELETLRIKEEQEEKAYQNDDVKYYIVESKGRDSMESEIRQIVEVMKRNTQKRNTQKRKTKKSKLNMSSEYANFSICKNNYY